MACCGRRAGSRGRGGGGNPQTVTINEPGEMVILEYQGSKKGTMSRRGPVTKTWYTFSASPVGKRFVCAKADAQYLMRMGDLVVVSQQQPRPAPAPAPQPVRAAPMPAPIPQVRAVPQPTIKAPVSLDEEPPADDLSAIKGITRDTAGILALVGIRTFGNLATLNAQGITRAAQLTGKSEGHVESWTEQARAILEGDNESAVGNPGNVGLDLLDDVQLADGEDQE
jgi:predicted flap endonuclease-1-like 5' DNA nuclease